ncbi:tetratricopeptide repeat protein [Desulfurella sp.]|uniref:tetratricopeptide repeat protein n=1 Tax=Desulfurella sp. TaxID=1962857 RepID=UPI0025BED53D|nr:tetratricopeptide repeat protein [Desulfurella sp.]
MRKKLVLFCVICVMFLLSSCASNQQIQNINYKLSKIENATNQNSRDLDIIKPKVRAIEEKLNALTKKIDLLENSTNSTKKAKISEKTFVEASFDNSTNNIISKIPPAEVVFSKKNQEIQKKVENNENKQKKENITQKFVLPSSEAFKVYNDALSTYMKRDFSKALEKFLQYSKDYPHTTLEQNAIFWIGNSYYNLNDYDKALSYFSDCLNNFPKKPTSEGGKTDACLFMLYKTYKAKGNTQKAYDYLMQLKKEYPINPYFEFRGVKN